MVLKENLPSSLQSDAYWLLRSPLKLKSYQGLLLWLIISHRSKRTAVGGQIGDLEFVLSSKFTIKHSHTLGEHTHTHPYMTSLINGFDLICLWVNVIISHTRRCSIYPSEQFSLSLRKAGCWSNCAQGDIHRCAKVSVKTHRLSDCRRSSY